MAKNSESPKKTREGFRVSVSFDERDWRKLRRIAPSIGVSASALVRIAVKEYLKKHAK